MMIIKSFLRFYTFCLVFIAMPFMVSAETIGLFYDSNVAQIKFAADDIKAELELKNNTVEVFQLSALNESYANKKIVIALANNTTVAALLIAQGGTVPTGLVAQGYGLRTTTATNKSYWVIGGDANGAMYGGLQMAENIRFEALAGTYNNEEAPAIVRRGIKLNLPFDKAAGTYGKPDATSKVNAIANVWDIAFWQRWFDTMARNRFNVVSVWSNHPFTSFVKVPGYENCAIQDVTGINGVKIKTMTIEQKIVFWKEVMKYAHDRGFEFFLFNWNLFLDNAAGKYGITDGDGKVTNPANIAYMRKSMTTLWETYPDLDGFGITQGESMNGTSDQNDYFMGATYGQGTLDYAKNHPERTIRIIHRWHLTDFTNIKTHFGPLMNLPNIKFEMSYKHSLAHMYSLALPDRMPQEDKDALVTEKLKSFLTVRNDDFYYHNWGDPTYARAYVNGMIKRGTEGAGNTGNWLAGFYIGSDSYSPTRTFFSKNSVTQGILEIDRQWYMNMLWGRLSYNPKTSDAVFKNRMAARFPSVTSNDLFTAWQKASKPFTDLGELICGTMGRDNQWWPEACQAIGPDETVGKVSAFLTVDDFGAANPMTSSTLASIAATASGVLGGKKSALLVADEMEASANASIAFANTITAEANTDLGVMANNLKVMSYLSNYYAYKVRGAIYKKQNKTADARTAMGKAYCWWMSYTNLMDANFNSMNLARSAPLANWHSNDAAAMKEYTDLGGLGIPNCTNADPKVLISANFAVGGTVSGEGTYKNGDSVTVIATSNPGFIFESWKENNMIISTDSIYKFMINSDRFLIANFKSNLSCFLPWTDNGFTQSIGTIQKKYGPIDISCATTSATISFMVASVGALESNQDFCKASYSLEGGAPIPFGQVLGNATLQTISVSNVVGKNVEIIFDVTTSHVSEIYNITKIVISDGLTSVGKIDVSEIDIFPNPASTILNISFPNNQLNKEVQVINSLGQLVKIYSTKDSKLEIDVEALKLKGIIFIKVKNNNKVSNHKVVVK